MKAEIKQAWIEALRGGEYEQGQKALHRENCFCCLGVLCDLAAKAGIGRWESTGYQFAFVTPSGYYKDGEHYEVEFLPQAVIDWAETVEADPYAVNMSLSTYNDSEEREYTFAEIADLIEQHL